MENILPKRISKAAWLVLFGISVTLMCGFPISAQGESSPPSEETAQYQGYIESGKRYLNQGKYREAIAEFNRALLLDPASDEAKRSIIKANQEIAARSAAPDITSIEEDRLSFHLAKGTEYYDAEKYDEATAEWEEVLRIDPDNRLARSLIEAAKRAKVDLLIEKGHDAFFAENFDEAIAIWEEAREIVPLSKVINDLLAEANMARHAREVERIENDYRQQELETKEFILRKSLYPEGASPDGLKRKDISEKPPIRAPKPFGAREAILKELAQPVAFEFECEPLRDVLRFLTTITGINILVDEDIFEQFGQKEDCYGNTEDRKKIFVTIHVSELPLESALNGMLRQHGLGFSIERDFIYVSSPDILRGSSFEQLETRFYHLKDTARLSLPKLDTSGTSGTVALGGTALNLASGASLLGRVRRVAGTTVQELEGDYSSMSIPKLVNILRTFIPTVLDPTKQAKRRTGRVGQDRLYGGMKKGSEQISLFNAPRQLWSDINQREILSLIDYDPHTNTLIVRNTPTNLDMVEVFLDHLDDEPRQISVEAKFITYSMVEAKRAGIDFEFGGTETAGDFVDTARFETDRLGEESQMNLRMETDITEGIIPSDLVTRGADILFRFTKADGDYLAATINLLEELRSTETVNAPRLVTLSNKAAVIQNVRTRSFRSDLTVTTDITTSEAGQTTTNTNIEQDFTDVTEGTTLSITPQIQADNTIRLFVLPDVAEITDVDEFQVQTGSQDNIVVNIVTRPQVTRQSLFTNVVVNDGDTIVVGGFINDKTWQQDTGVPFFRDIPLFGRVFENQTDFTDKVNLLIFITVNIMDSEGVVYTRLK